MQETLGFLWNGIFLVGAVASGLVMLRTHVLFEVAELGKLTVAVFHLTLELFVLDLLLISTLNLANVWVDSRSLAPTGAQGMLICVRSVQVCR